LHWSHFFIKKSEEQRQPPLLKTSSITSQYPPESTSSIRGRCAPALFSKSGFFRKKRLIEALAFLIEFLPRLEDALKNDLVQEIRKDCPLTVTLAVVIVKKMNPSDKQIDGIRLALRG
jgi:hypothetical protein